MAPETQREKTRTVGRRATLIAPLVCLLLLSGVAADRILFHLPLGNAGAYHDVVKAHVDSIPMKIGDWEGTREEIPPAATKLLRPNVTLGVRYLNTETERWVKLLIVHCRDARDMGGHYPPICYRANGWVNKDTRSRDWQVEDLKIPGKEYTFESGDFHDRTTIVVYNFILRPDGLIERDIKGLREAGYDPRKKSFGGGQVQLLFDASVDEAERDEIAQTILGACLPTIRTVISGVTQ